MTGPAAPRPHSDGDRVGALVVGPALLGRGAADGPLAGRTFVAKDLLDVAGLRTGAGNPTWEEDAAPAPAHAPAVQRLLDAGADLIGKAVTDELAFSLSGTNVHHGTPVNVNAPGRVPGGSSSGPAAAVAAGLCDVALGTDTAGSVRVPSSYCGVWGLRPTHDAGLLRGVVPLAPSFDTVGVLAATGPLLETAGRALLGVEPAEVPARLVVADDLLSLADPEAAEAVLEAAAPLADRLGATLTHLTVAPDRGALERWYRAFLQRMLFEAWASHGEWITARRPRLGPGITDRFEVAAQIPDPGRAAEDAAGEVRAAVSDALGEGSVLVLPSAPAPALPLELEKAAKEDLQSRALRLNGVASLAGLPSVSLPLAQLDGLPLGLALLGSAGTDATLLAAASAGQSVVDARAC